MSAEIFPLESSNGNKIIHSINTFYWKGKLINQ